MSDNDNVPVEPVPEDEETSTYKPPPEKSLDEMLAQDQEDEALQKYKQTLLGSASKGAVVIDPSNENRVLVNKLILMVENYGDRELDLSNIDAIKDSNFTLKGSYLLQIFVQVLFSCFLLTSVNKEYLQELISYPSLLTHVHIQSILSSAGMKFQKGFIYRATKFIESISLSAQLYSVLY